jgi:hypothetical protein
MLEHMKNYKMLMSKISSWLRPKTSTSSEDSLFFVHIFCHKQTPYHFEEGDGWMAQNFFSGMFDIHLSLSRSGSYCKYL